MVVIPINTDTETHLILIIESDNLKRMKTADPITLHCKQSGGLLDIKHPNNYRMTVAYEEDQEELYRLAKTKDIKALEDYVNRGYKFISGRDGLVGYP